MADPTPPDEQDLQAPPRFLKALGESGKETILIPPAVDSLVLEGVGPQLASIRRRRARQRNRRNLLALAASLVVFGWIVNLALSPVRVVGPSAPEDINHDGKVDILDAFQLARQIKSGEALSAKLDLNGDGRVDASDVDFIARRAVSLEKGSM